MIARTADVFEHEFGDLLAHIIALALTERKEDGLAIRKILIQRADADARTLSDAICG